MSDRCETTRRAGRQPTELLPDLPTLVRMPGHTIEREVGGHVCLNSGVPFIAPQR